MNTVKIARQALIVPATKGWDTQALGVGTVVRLLDSSEHESLGFSPFTNDDSELAVEWVDVIGRATFGWLDARTQLRAVKSGTPLTYQSCDPEDVGTPLDRLRGICHYNGLSFERWLRRFGGQPDYRPLLSNVVRELGGRLRESDDTSTVLSLVARLVLNKELDMADNEQETTTDEGGTTTKARKTKSSKGSAKKSAKKAGAKNAGAKGSAKRKARDTESTPRGSAGANVGAALVPLLKGHKDIRALAERLRDGETLKTKDLIKLRDGVNQAANDSRVADDGERAAALSAANRHVRRLARLSAAG